MQRSSAKLLEAELRARGVKRVVLMGLFQEHCVAATAEDAARAGFTLHTNATVLQSNHGKSSFDGWPGIEVDICDDIERMLGFAFDGG